MSDEIQALREKMAAAIAQDKADLEERQEKARQRREREQAIAVRELPRVIAEFTNTLEALFAGLPEIEFDAEPLVVNLISHGQTYARVDAHKITIRRHASHITFALEGTGASCPPDIFCPAHIKVTFRGGQPNLSMKVSGVIRIETERKNSERLGLFLYESDLGGPGWSPLTNDLLVKIVTSVVLHRTVP